MNKIGTKGILDDIEKATTLRKLIVEYDENHKKKSKFTYKDIYEFIDKVDFYPGIHGYKKWLIGWGNTSFVVLLFSPIMNEGVPTISPPCFL
ncbi:hypothetical protein KFZ58_07820 [Virgibacillus sp. NKC19-16]|uniref:hypothetical protein n=1 Tax=Virgibacillus salidurans TaxID=2831673 RepID=UPI001F35BC9E|nr:hypothetical protein [Virgibacillus sp. NKC19-16]UJL47752.1 hypothetical protein KFZ58_07820 [Virgibacillus sp. NKC19-16]